MAFQKGNKLGGYNKKARLFDEALRRAVAQCDAKKVRDAAEKLLDLAAAGEMWAIKELADRLDGKAAQTVDVNHHRDKQDMTIDQLLAELAANRAQLDSLGSIEKETSDSELSKLH